MREGSAAAPVLASVATTPAFRPVAFLAVAFLAVAFLAVAFLAVAFLAVFLVVVFPVAVFLAVAFFAVTLTTSDPRERAGGLLLDLDAAEVDRLESLVPVLAFLAPSPSEVPPEVVERPEDRFEGAPPRRRGVLSDILPTIAIEDPAFKR